MKNTFAKILFLFFATPLLAEHGNSLRGAQGGGGQQGGQQQGSGNMLTSLAGGMGGGGQSNQGGGKSREKAEKILESGDKSNQEISKLPDKVTQTADKVVQAVNQFADRLNSSLSDINLKIVEQASAENKELVEKLSDKSEKTFADTQAKMTASHEEFRVEQSKLLQQVAKSAQPEVAQVPQPEEKITVRDRIALASGGTITSSGGSLSGGAVAAAMNATSDQGRNFPFLQGGNNSTNSQSGFGGASRLLRSPASTSSFTSDTSFFDKVKFDIKASDEPIPASKRSQKKLK